MYPPLVEYQCQMSYSNISVIFCPQVLDVLPAFQQQSLWLVLLNLTHCVSRSTIMHLAHYFWVLMISCIFFLYGFVHLQFLSASHISRVRLSIITLIKSVTFPFLAIWRILKPSAKLWIVLRTSLRTSFPIDLSNMNVTESIICRNISNLKPNDNSVASLYFLSNLRQSSPSIDELSSSLSLTFIALSSNFIVEKSFVEPDIFNLGKSSFPMAPNL